MSAGNSFAGSGRKVFGGSFPRTDLSCTMPVKRRGVFIGISEKLGWEQEREFKDGNGQ